MSHGSRSIIGTVSSSWSQSARLATKRWALGRRATGVSRLPAGTTRGEALVAARGSAEPQVLQKLLAWRVEGR